MKSEQELWFATERIRDDLYCITEPHYTCENRANLWLIKGRDADLLIDTGLGVSSLKPCLDTRKAPLCPSDKRARQRAVKSPKT